MLNEIWKPIAHYEDSYVISNYGRIKSLSRITYMPDGITPNGYIKEHFVSQHDNGRGYLFVCLYKHNKPKREYVHRLVAITFIDNPKCLPQVNHKDEDKQNNYVENLEWCDAKYNNTYGTARERRVNTCKKRGVYEHHRQRMLSDKNPSKQNPKYGGKNSYAKKVICDGKTFDCIKDCAEYYGIRPTTMRVWLSNDCIPKYFKEHNLHYLE